jgi:hypothetical protein
MVLNFAVIAVKTSVIRKQRREREYGIMPWCVSIPATWH